MVGKRRALEGFRGALAQGTRATPSLVLFLDFLDLVSFRG